MSVPPDRPVDPGDRAVVRSPRANVPAWCPRVPGRGEEGLSWGR